MLETPSKRSLRFPYPALGKAPASTGLFLFWSQLRLPICARHEVASLGASREGARPDRLSNERGDASVGEFSVRFAGGVDRGGRAGGCLCLGLPGLRRGGEHGSSCPAFPQPVLSVRMQPPVTRYVQREEISIAYQVAGGRSSRSAVLAGLHLASRPDVDRTAVREVPGSPGVVRATHPVRQARHGLSDPTPHHPTVEERAVLDATLFGGARTHRARLAKLVGQRLAGARA